jgi:outer membrane lipoprotein-sorting protein
MRLFITLALAATAFLLSSAAAFNAYSAQLSPYEIAKKSDDALNRAADAKSEMSMQIFDRNGSRRGRRIISYAKRYPNGDRKTLLVFDYPADVKGSAFLVWDPKEKDDQQWLYLPALEKIRQIAPGDKGGSFMGSDFSYYDMGGMDVEDFTYRLLREESVEGSPCYVIESTPAKGIPYGRVTAWIRKDNFLPARSDIYDRNGELMKQCLSGAIRVINNIPTPTHVVMKQVKEPNYTVMDLKNIIYDSGLSDSIFTQRYMQRGR